MSAAVPEFRTPVMTLVEASWEDQNGSLQTVAARMEDKSAGGACIRVKTPIRVGSKLGIQWRFEQFSGTARYCRREGREYLVGIQRHATKSPIPKQPGASEPVATLPVATQPVPTQPVSIDVSVPKTGSSSDPAVSTTETQSKSQWPETKPNEISVARRKTERVTTVNLASDTALMLPPEQGCGTGNRSDPGSQPRNFDALRRAEPKIQELSQQKQSGKERKHMRGKWLGILPWHHPQGDTGSSGDPDGDRKSNGKGERENLMPEANSSTKKAPVHSARDVPNFQVELLPMEDIYRAAGIMNARRGYSANKVVEMLQSEHIRGLSNEMKRAAVLMALDAAGVSLEQVQRDAKTRQDALDSHEAQQKIQVEAEWARKAEEIVQIQAELESIKAHYTARIARNLEGVAREKATFNSWLTLKQQECQSMSEAVDLCLKSPISEPAAASPAEFSIAAPVLQPASELAKNSISEVSMPKGAGAKPVWFPH